MSDLLVKCAVCGAMLDEEDIFCPNCGTEAPVPGADSSKSSENKAPAATLLATYNFTCRGCGASMSYDASAQSLRCPFCGSEKLDKEPDAKEIAPDGVVPFVISRDKAVAAMRQWLGQGFWRPGDLATQAAIVKMTPVYVPYWVFDANTHTYWTADSSHVPMGAAGNWHPESGSHEGEYIGLLVGASAALTGAETKSLIPFDLSAAVTPDKVDLRNITYERFVVPRKYARPLARQGLESLEAEACQQYVTGSCRNMKVNVRITDLASRPMLLPVWIMAYRYRDQVFRFIANGQSGKSAGQAPLSYRKIGAAVVIAAILIALAVLFFAGQIRSRQERSFRFSAVDGIWYIAGSNLTPVQFCFTDDISCASRLYKPPTQLPLPPSRMKMIGCCAPSGLATWSGNAKWRSDWALRSMRPASGAKRWGTFCSTVRPGWAKPRSPCAFRANWA